MSELELWKSLNDRGFVPGPDESEEDFYKRIAFNENLEPELIKHAASDLPFEVGDQKSKVLLQSGLGRTAELYGIRPDWVPLFFNNFQLAPWHGGCAWIFQLGDDLPTAAFLQLRSRFRAHDTYLGLYHRDELIAHELSHVGRMMYNEPQFEEVIAYRSSKNTWRRWFGPIVQSSKESLFFILVLGLFVITDAALISVYSPAGATVLFGFKLFLIALVVLALGRLTWRQGQFNRCLKNLSILYPNPDHLAYRLTDHEIKLFASSSSGQIQSYIDRQTTFRWKFLKELARKYP